MFFHDATNETGHMLLHKVPSPAASGQSTPVNIEDASQTVDLSSQPMSEGSTNGNIQSPRHNESSTRVVGVELHN